MIQQVKKVYNHAPGSYLCPFCLLLNGIENEHVLSVKDDVFYQDSKVTAFIGSHQWPRNQGHALVIPNQHYENIYDLPPDYGTAIQHAAQQVALAMKVLYGCDGVSTRQHNEPAGNQDVWHYHLHVFPRYNGDQLYGSEPEEMPPEVRARFAHDLRQYLRKNIDAPHRDCEDQ